MSGLLFEPGADLSIPADIGKIRDASAWLERAGSERQVPADPMWRLDLCLNEALANAIDYGGMEILSSPINLRFEVRRDSGNGEAEITLSDAGKPYDPLAVTPKSIPRSLAEARPGGLGIPLLRNFADGLSYRHAGGRNHLIFSVRWEEAD